MSLLRILLGYTLLQSSKSDKAWFFWGIWSITMYHQVGIWILWSTVPGRWRWSVQQQLGRDSSCDPMMPSLEHPVMVCRSPKKHWNILIEFPKFDRDLSKMSWTQLNYAELLDLLIWFIYDIWYIYRKWTNSLLISPARNRMWNRRMALWMQMSLLPQGIGWKCRHTSLSVLKANVTRLGET